MAENVKKIVDQIKTLSIVEAFELKKALEEEFGVQAAAPMAMMAAPAAASAEPVEEKTEFNVTLTGVAGDKISVIKAVKDVTGLGLKEAKDVVEGAPKLIAEAVSKEKAEEISKKITEAGGKVEVK